MTLSIKNTAGALYKGQIKGENRYCLWLRNSNVFRRRRKQSSDHIYSQNRYNESSQQVRLEAQLSQRGSATLHIIENFAKSLKITQGQ